MFCSFLVGWWVGCGWWVGAMCFALCHLPVGRVGRVRRVGHLIFKKEMPESFALGRCLDHLMRNSMRKAPCRCLAKSCAKLLAGCIAFCDSDSWRSSLQMVRLNPARSSESKFQETIVPRVIRVSHVPPHHRQIAKHTSLTPLQQSAWQCISSSPCG